jgi:rRNA-processing protein FCF1
MMEKPGKREKRVIILDSNAFFVPTLFKIDVFEGLKALFKANVEPVLLSPVRKELEKVLAGGTAKTRRNAVLALKIAERCKMIELEKAESSSTDDVIVETARRWQCPVFTNDKQLRKRLRDINVPVVYVRQKSRLAIDGRL